MVGGRKLMLPRRRVWQILAVATVVLFALLMPLPVRDIDKDAVIADSFRNLRDQNRVLLDWKYQQFYDAVHISKSVRTWHYSNDTPLQNSTFEALGLQRLPEEYREHIPGDWYTKGNVLVEATYRDTWGRSKQPQLRFNYYHGSLGAQGYRVHIYRCLLGRFVRYTLEWVS
jgi:hypothetical protein